MPITTTPECVRRNHNSVYTVCPYTGAPIIKKRALSDAFRALRAPRQPPDAPHAQAHGAHVPRVPLLLRAP